MPVRPALNLRIADRLLEDGILTEDDHERAVEYARERQQRIEEALLELELLSENDLLQYVSRLHQTQFVSTEKMSRAKVDHQALRLVPKKIAELYGLYPLLYEPQANRLVVATPDPDNLTALDELKVATRVREVRALAARPAAVAAAMARGYEDDKYAFTDLLRGASTSFGELQLGDPFAGDARQAPRARDSRPVRRSEPAPARPEPGERPAPEREAARRHAQGRPAAAAYPEREAFDEPRPAPAQRPRPEPQPRPAARPPATEQQRWPRPAAGPPARVEESSPPRRAAPEARGRERAVGERPLAERAGGERPRPLAPPPAQVPEFSELDEPDWATTRRGPASPTIPEDMVIGGPAPRAEPAPLDRGELRRAIREKLVSAPAIPVRAAREVAGRPERVDLRRPTHDQPDSDRPPRAERGDLRRPTHDQPAQEHSPPARAAREPVPVRPEARSPAREHARPEVGELPLVSPAGRAFETKVSGLATPDPRVDEPEPSTDRPELQPISSRRSLPPPPSRLNLGPLGRRPSERPPAAPLSSALGGPSTIEMLRVLVGLLENDRDELRGHSSLVARLTQDACERIHLSEAHTTALVVAAYLHDLGKRSAIPTRRRDEAVPPALHLTALNAAQFAPHRELANKLVSLPEQLMAGAGLAPETVSALRTMYEQLGGKGLPAGLSGSDIPIGGRVLAVADSYADLTQNARNAYSKLMSPEEAMAELRRHVDVVFDPNIIEVFEHAMTGEKIVGQLLEERHRVLIVDPDPEQTLVLQLRLTDQGFDVHLARNTKEARAALKSRKFALVVSEIDLEERDAGMFLREEVAKSEQGRGQSWVFLSSRSSRNTAKRAFDLGVDDFIAKPTSADIVVAKLAQLIDRIQAKAAEKPADPRGVAGSLSDMGLTDLVQVLWQGRRTCSLHIEAGDAKGEIHFKEGQLVNATWGDATGEVAFYRMLAGSDNGRFQVDPSFVPQGEPTIQRSPEGLLLEGMRLIDEKIVP